MPSAGPYYVASRTPNRLVVVKRNPNYHGHRGRTTSDLIIVRRPTPSQNQSLLQIKAGEADYELGAAPAARSRARKQFGVNKSRFFVHTANIVFYAGAEHPAARPRDAQGDQLRDRPPGARSGRRARSPARADRPDPAADAARLPATRCSTRSSGPDVAKAKKLMGGTEAEA